MKLWTLIWYWMLILKIQSQNPETFCALPAVLRWDWEWVNFHLSAWCLTTASTSAFHHNAWCFHIPFWKSCCGYFYWKKFVFQVIHTKTWSPEYDFLIRSGLNMSSGAVKASSPTTTMLPSGKRRTFSSQVASRGPPPTWFNFKHFKSVRTPGRLL